MANSIHQTRNKTPPIGVMAPSQVCFVRTSAYNDPEKNSIPTTKQLAATFSDRLVPLQLPTTQTAISPKAWYI